ncbi:dolichyl-phosphate-mannose--protein mannosyltransferase [Nocardioides houyundeii]|uniref:dolichyl-phosphate-mannose--protein mannosyltransferase n=1 Tax=Nocardioides houyundeii TaxID=2045452 RepID=UPI001F080AEB|nr:phospholipid carrier-dependent glycosyltransferase [Nocardioides houyundeii]
MTPALRRRLPGDQVIGWVGAVLLGCLAFFLRVWRLGTPHAFSFDETYYAKDAWSLLHHGYSRGYVDGADASILDGKTDGLWTDSPNMVVHPEVGKWLIALGEKALGMDPTGWRIASAVVGSLMIVLMCRFATRVTGSVFLGLLAGFLLSLDGLHLVLSRLALLDIFLAFFMLGGVHCVVADRQWFTARLAREPRVTGGWGPHVWFRPWLLASGVWFGLAVGTKWTALFPLAAFGLLVWAWSAGARRGRGVRWPVLRSAVLDGVPAFVHLVLVAFVVYVTTWTGWLIHADDYEQALSNTQYTTYGGGTQWPSATEPDAEGLGEVVQSLRSLASYHRDVYVFHSHFLNDATHVYSSKPAGWLLMNRAVGVDAQLDIQPGTQGCEAEAGSTCLRQVVLLGNPILWWGGCVALLAAVVLWVGSRDWRFGVAVVGTASTWLPWLQYDDRTIFLFYAIAIAPFMVLAVVLGLAKMLGPSPLPSRRRTLGAVLGGSFVVSVVLAFAWFWPVWTDQLITHSEWLDRMWFKRWI